MAPPKELLAMLTAWKRRMIRGSLAVGSVREEEEQVVSRLERAPDLQHAGEAEGGSVKQDAKHVEDTDRGNQLQGYHACSDEDIGPNGRSCHGGGGWYLRSRTSLMDAQKGQLQLYVRYEHRYHLCSWRGPLRMRFCCVFC